MEARGYIYHSMIERSVPQNIQQQVIRAYCEKNNLQFLLSATEFHGHTIMLESIKENIIVMYSLFCMPLLKEARERLYASGKKIHFAAENMRMAKDLVETVFGVYHARSSVRDTVARLKQKRLLCEDEPEQTQLYADCVGVWTDVLGRTS